MVLRCTRIVPSNPASLACGGSTRLMIEQSSTKYMATSVLYDMREEADRAQAAVSILLTYCSDYLDLLTVMGNIAGLICACRHLVLTAYSMPFFCLYVDGDHWRPFYVDDTSSKNRLFGEHSSWIYLSRPEAFFWARTRSCRCFSTGRWWFFKWERAVFRPCHQYMHFFKFWIDLSPKVHWSVVFERSSCCSPNGQLRISMFQTGGGRMDQWRESLVPWRIFFRKWIPRLLRLLSKQP